MQLMANQMQQQKPKEPETNIVAEADYLTCPKMSNIESRFYCAYSLFVFRA